jgi:hypothetical protein
MLSRLPYSGKEVDLVQPDRRVAFEFSPADLSSGRLER